MRPRDVPRSGPLRHPRRPRGPDPPTPPTPQRSCGRSHGRTG
nr:MAG TPA: hypothetical protein [Caudoviricetes sp.]